MNTDEFCKHYSDFFGEKTSKLEQIAMHQFDGKELFEFASYLLKQQEKQFNQIESVCEYCGTSDKLRPINKTTVCLRCDYEF